MAPERGSLQGLLGASVPCDVTLGLAFPNPSPGGYPPHSGPQTKPKPNPNLPRLASIQYKNGNLRQSIVASPPLYYGIERQNQSPITQTVALEQGARDAGDYSGEDGGQASAGRNLDRVTALLALATFVNHSTPCFLSPPLYRRVARPFGVVVLWCCGAVVLSIPAHRSGLLCPECAA